MASNTETATARIFMDGQQAGVELKKLEDQTSDLRREIIRLNKEGKSKEAEARKKDLKILQRETRKLKTETFDTTKVLKNLNGVSLAQLESAQKKLIKAQKSLNQGSIAYKQNMGDLSKVSAQLKKVKAEMYAQMSPGQKMISTVKGWLPAFGFVAILGGLKAVAGELLNLTKEMQGDAVRSTTVLGDSYAYVAMQAETMAAKMGLTERKFISNTAAAADLLVPLGFQRDVAAEMAVKLQSLVGPLDEWTGGQIGATEVSNILTKALLGENEQLKQLGVAIKMDSKEFTDLVKLYQQRENVTKAQAQAMAELELITRKSADAQTAYNGNGNKLLRLEKQLTVWWQRKKEAVVAYFDTNERTKTEDEIKRVNTLTIEMTSSNTTAERRNEIYEELQRIAPDVVKNIDLENISISTLRGNLERYNEAMIKKLALQDSESALEKEREKAGKATSERVEKEMDIRDKLFQLQERARKLNNPLAAQLKEISTAEGDVIEKMQEAYDLIKEDNKMHLPNAKFLIGEVTNARKEEQEALENVNTAMGDYMARYEAIFGKGGNEEIVAKDYKILSTKTYSDDSEEEYAEAEQDADTIISKYLKANETQINSYIEGRKQLAEIQKEFGLQEGGAQHAEAMAELQKLRDDDVISLGEYEAAKKGIKDAYKIMNLEADVLEADTEQEIWDAKFDLVQERYDQEFAAAEGNRLKELQAKKKYEGEVDKIEDARVKSKIEKLNREKAIKDAETDVAMQGLAALRSIVGEETALGKMLFLAEQAMAVGRIWFHTGIANAKAVAAMPLTGGQPWVGINTASAGVQTAKVVAQTLKGFSTGGDTGEYSRTDIAGVVHGQEYVIPADLYKDDPLVSALVSNIIEPKRAGIRGINYAAANNNIDTVRGYSEGGEVAELSGSSDINSILSKLNVSIEDLNQILSHPLLAKISAFEVLDELKRMQKIKNRT